ncbi:uncharacterized protein METZ01_LOCUS88900 [marine metagenome]|uniref:Uncharacterized protein n=1 Tax=marine metagenome TaxID=408172 RepID=A0A381V6P3_9ZZZZ
MVTFLMDNTEASIYLISDFHRLIVMVKINGKD